MVYASAVALFLGVLLFSYADRLYAGSPGRAQVSGSVLLAADGDSPNLLLAPGRERPEGREYTSRPAGREYSSSPQGGTSGEVRSRLKKAREMFK
jgi:hypothetical protein